MTLLYRGETRFDLIGATPVKLPLLLKGNKGVICRVDCQQAKRTWKTLGSLEHYTFDQDFGTIKLGSYPIPLSTDTLVDLRVVPNSWLVFSPVPWLVYRTNITIFSTEDLSVEIQVPDLAIADEDAILARDYSDNYTLKRTTFSQIVSFVREKFADLVEAIATNTSNITANTSAIATNTSNITANTSAIATNTSNITANTSAITVLNAQSGITSGVDIQYSSTKPTTRRNGTALQSGDLWKKIGQELCEFDGTYWTGSLESSQLTTTGIISTSTSTGLYIPYIGAKILAKRLDVIGRYESIPANTSTDFWTFALSYIRGGSSGAITPSISVNNQGQSYAAFSSLYLGVNLNQVLDFSGNPNASLSIQRGLITSWAKNSAASPNLTGLAFVLKYRVIYE